MRRVTNFLSTRLTFSVSRARSQCGNNVVLLRSIGTTGSFLPANILRHSSQRTTNNLVRHYGTNESDDSVAVWEEAATVRTWATMNGPNAEVNISWGKDDVLHQPIESAESSIIFAEIMAANLALRQAVHERKLERVIVHTASEYVANCINKYLAKWRTNGFITREGRPVKYKEDLQEMDRLIQEIQVRAQYIPQERPSYAQREMPSTSNASAVTVYTAGEFSQTDIFSTGGCGVHWPNRPDLDKSARFSDMPITHFRAQLFAIILALEQAVSNGIKHLTVVTDASAFLRLYYRKWIKNDGTQAANVYLYQRILTLAQQVKVQFVLYTDQVEEKTKMGIAKDRAVDGLAYPLVEKAVNSWDKAYKMHLQETNDWQNVPVVYLITTNRKVDDKERSFSAVYYPGKEEDNIFLSLGESERASVACIKLLYDVLQSAVARENDKIIVRTTHIRLARSVIQWMPGWRQRHFYNTKGAKIANAKLFEEISNELQHIDIRFELLGEEPQSNDDKVAHEYLNKQADSAGNS